MSIIADALKKVKKERDDTGYPDGKTVTPENKGPAGPPQSYSSSLFFRSEGAWTPRRRRSARKALAVSISILILVFLFLAVWNVFLAPSSNVSRMMTPLGHGKEGDAAPEAEGYSDLKNEIMVIERKEGVIEKMADALKGVSAKDEFLGSFRLNGIVYDSEDPWAIINDKVLRAGDELDGAKVISIAPRKVVLLFKNERFDLVVR